MINTTNHPISILKSIVHRLPRHEAKLEFSRYIYTVRGKTDQRDIIVIDANMLTDDWLMEKLCGLENGQELACHSKILIGSDIYHIPFIDFEVTELKELPDVELNSISRRINSELYVFSSGTSFHGYFETFISHNDWLFFLGEMLLLNNLPKCNPNIIDSRWVGHSLQQNFGALRWSNMTKGIMPTLITLK